MNTAFDVIAIVNLILTVIMFPFIIILLVEYRSFNKSTHRIEYQPIPNGDVLSDEIVEDGMSAKEFEKFINPDDGFLE